MVLQTLMDIPRDIELKILSKLDMDGRISMGIIGKLKIPENVRELFEKIQIPSHEVGPRYTIQFKKKGSFCTIIACDTLMNNKMVTHIKPGLVLDYWYLNDDHTSWYNLSAPH